MVFTNHVYMLVKLCSLILTQFLVMSLTPQSELRQKSLIQPNYRSSIKVQGQANIDIQPNYRYPVHYYLAFCHSNILPSDHPAIISSCHPIILPQSSFHPAILSSYHPGIPSSCHSIIQLFHHSAIISSYHTNLEYARGI